VKKILLPFFLFLLMSITTAFASSNLEISSSSDFSITSTDFGGGQTIFVRIESDLPGMAQSKLILHDNAYNIVNTFNLNKEGNYFSAVLPTPYTQGYYSLEAKIGDGDSSLTSVKTIKVGNPTNANVKVNVNNNVSGSSANVLGEKEDGDTNGQIDVSPSPEPVDYSDEGDEFILDAPQKSFGQFFDLIFRKVIDFLWPF
jgi:hypothetical protein